jgi:hypothetical protein
LSRLLKSGKKVQFTNSASCTAGVKPVPSQAAQAPPFVPAAKPNQKPILKKNDPPKKTVPNKVSQSSSSSSTSDKNDFPSFQKKPSFACPIAEAALKGQKSLRATGRNLW